MRFAAACEKPLISRRPRRTAPFSSMMLSAMTDVDGQALQDGCRSMTYSSLYVNEDRTDRIWYMAARDNDYKLVWNCKEGEAAFYDLAADPATLDPIDLDASPAAHRYTEALTAYLVEARRVNPELRCPITSSLP